MRRARRGARSWGVLAVLAGVGFVAPSCSAGGYRYVTHRDAGGASTYFKLPTRWRVFDQRQLLEAANGPLSSAQVSQLAGQAWNETFSANPHASVNQSSAIGGRYPTGYAEVRPLSSQEQDGFSLSSLRTEVLPNDPLSAAPGSPYQVVSYTPITRPGGLRGSTMTVNIKTGSGAVDTLDQVALVDSPTHWVYLLALGCSASCYGANQGLINQVVKSWTVREP